MWKREIEETLRIYRGDGTVHPGPRTDYNVRGRHPVAWTCEGLEEMAHGTCDRNLGSFGDRFIQLLGGSASLLFSLKGH